MTDTALAGRVVAVTGAAQGIGLATARALRANGARVALGDLDGERARAAAEELGEHARGLPLDVRDLRSFAEFLGAAERDLGPLHALVNNAGIMGLGSLVDEAADVTDRQIDVNLRGVIHGAKAAVPLLRRHGGGHLVNVASTLGKSAQPGAATYCATKHAVVGLSEALRGELRPDGVHVSVVMPHVTRTAMAEGLGRARVGFSPVAPERVAAAILATLVRPRFEVYVPASHRPAYVLLPLLAPRARDALHRVLGTGRILGDVDRERRARYDRELLEPRGSANA